MAHRWKCSHWPDRLSNDVKIAAPGPERTGRFSLKDLPMRLLLLLSALTLMGCAATPDFRSQADVVIVGEVHGVAEHHAYQAQVAAEIQPSAIVFEQLPGSQSARLAGLLRSGAGATEISRALDWQARGWPDFAFYHDIMLAAPSAQILGAEATRAALETARRDGAAAAFGTGAERYGLTEPLPAVQRATRELAQVDAHCGLITAQVAAGFVEAQRYRDALLAQTVVLARERTGNGRVLVITGNGHARVDHGVPALLAIADPRIATFAIGQVAPGDDAPFNDVRIGAIPQAADPCASLRPSAS